MLNLNSCNCNDVNARKRSHHGVVCTTCNPSNIEPLFVPSEINAYRTWLFHVESGLLPLNTDQHTVSLFVERALFITTLFFSDLYQYYIYL